MSRWFRPRGSTARDGFELMVRPGERDWHHTGLSVRTLLPGQSVEIDTGDREYLVLPAERLGRGDRRRRDRAARRARRRLRRPDRLRLRARAVRRSRSSAPAAPGSPSRTRRQPGTTRSARSASSRCASELRGAGVASRQVRNFGTPGVLEADSIIACEVLTPAGNWSSYPPHKHDEHKPATRPSSRRSTTSSCSCRTPHRTVPRATIRSATSGSTAPTDRPIDVLAEVRTGDSCWSRTAGTARRWRRPATTCTT